MKLPFCKVVAREWLRSWQPFLATILGNQKRARPACPSTAPSATTLRAWLKAGAGRPGAGRNSVVLDAGDHHGFRAAVLDSVSPRPDSSHLRRVCLRTVSLAVAQSRPRSRECLRNRPANTKCRLERHAGRELPSSGRATQRNG